jgi:hypothetical protein
MIHLSYLDSLLNNLRDHVRTDPFEASSKNVSYQLDHSLNNFGNAILFGYSMGSPCTSSTIFLL